MLDKECLKPAMDQLHSTSRSFIYKVITNSISVWYLLLSFTTFLCQRQAWVWWVKHQFHKFASFQESSHRPTAPCSWAQGTTTASSHNTCCHDMGSPTCHKDKMLATAGNRYSNITYTMFTTSAGRVSEKSPLPISSLSFISGGSPELKAHTGEFP